MRKITTYLFCLVALCWSTCILAQTNCEGPLSVTMVGASSNAPITITEESSMVYCTKGVEGGAVITVYGGTPKYDYNWEHNNVNESFIEDLGVGSYYVTVTDANGCSEKATITIVQMDPLLDSLDLVDMTSCGTCYLNDKNQSFFYFEDEYIGAVLDIETDKDIGNTTMCTEIQDEVENCNGRPRLVRTWEFMSDSLERSDVRVFFSEEELLGLATASGYTDVMSFVNSNNALINLYPIGSDDCHTDIPKMTLFSGFSFTLFDDENDVWSVEIFGIDDSAIQILSKGIALPVEILSFDGEVREQTNHLYWATANEINNEKFEIEKSRDGLQFDYIGEVEAQNELSANYTFDDINPWSGSNFYRLRQVDYDNTFKYSHIVHLSRANKFNFKVLQNPFSQKLNLEIETNQLIDANITIFAMDGKIVHNKNVNVNEGVTKLDIDLSSLAAGNYLVRFFDKNSRIFKTEKIIKI